MKHSELKQLIKKEMHNALNENTQFPDTSLAGALKIHFQVAYEKGLEAQPEDGYDSFDEKYWKNNEFEIKDTIKKWFRFRPLTEEKKYLNDMSYEELIAHRKRMDFKKASREEKKYVKDLIDKKKPLTEDKGNELANKVIMNFRKALRNLNDDEVYSFREKIAMAIDANLK